MKALAIVLALLLLLAHPVGVAAVAGVELAVCGALGWLIWRALRLHPSLYWRTV